MDDKEIAKEILLKMLEHGSFKLINIDPGTNLTDAVCEAYKKILNAVKEG